MPACAGMMTRLLAIGLMSLAAPAAHAGIAFTPHLSEYSVLPRGSYADHTLVFTRIEDVYDREGNKVPLGTPALPPTPGTPTIPPGEHIDAALMLFRYLWVGNIFENTGVPYLDKHDQLFRVIANLGWQQGSEGVTRQSRLFDQRSNASGLGDVYLLGGIYGGQYRLGPLKANTLYSVTVKLPVGDYDQRSLLNIGTHYWTTIPQFALHAELFDRLQFDGTFAWQFNGSNDEPAYGGLTPTEPADVRNIELNLAWKFSEKWFVDAGWSHRESVGPNRFGKVTLSFKDPQPPLTACASLGVPPAQCSLLDNFRLDPVPGVREDRGVEGTLLTTGVYYVYRTSSVISVRAAIPIAGRGSQFPMEYDVYLGEPSGANMPISQQATVLNGVQESGAVSASPFYELRFVYLFWAP
jgi:hypothetical protein